MTDDTPSDQSQSRADTAFPGGSESEPSSDSESGSTPASAASESGSGPDSGSEPESDSKTETEATATTTPADETERVSADAFYDALERLDTPVVTAAQYARVREVSQATALDELEAVTAAGEAERHSVPGPAVWYPTQWGQLVDRERLVVFPNRREIIADQPAQFTRAQLSQFARLATASGDGAARYEIRSQDIWQAPHDSLEGLLGTVRQTLPKRYPGIEEWIESQYSRANQFRLYTHEDGYTVLAAKSADAMGNVARQLLDEQLRAPISDTESWVAEGRVAELKRLLYEADYPVQDERDLESGDALDIDLNLELRPYQQAWRDGFLETGAGVLVGPPGSGKTVTTLAIAAAVGGETLVLVPGRELAAQWREELLAHTSLSTAQVGEYHGGQKQIAPVTIATYRTAGMDRHRQLFDSRQWGLIVYEECLAGGTTVRTETGQTTFTALDETHGFDHGWNPGIEASVRTFTPETGYTWTNITGVYKTTKPVERIETATGHALRATREHLHVVFDPATGEVRSQRGVSAGDRLVLPISEDGDRSTGRREPGSPGDRAELTAVSEQNSNTAYRPSRYGTTRRPLATTRSQTTGGFGVTRSSVETTPTTAANRRPTQNETSLATVRPGDGHGCGHRHDDTDRHRPAPQLEASRTRLGAERGLRSVEVTAVCQEGVETVYDFETGTHTFLANGILTHNCHHIPSTIFRRSASLQTSHRLGLTSTPVRESDDEDEIFTLIGQPIGTDWEALFEAGYVAEPVVELRYLPWADDQARNEYVSSDGARRRQVAATNPAKIAEVDRLLTETDGQALVFVEYLDQGQAIADALGTPFISGETPHRRREALFDQFREGTLQTLVVSRVGDEGIDLPGAEVAIVASGLGGSRRQGAQRAGRTMRPTGQARMYVLATQGSREEEFARNRMRYLTEKGVRVTETTVDQR